MSIDLMREKGIYDVIGGVVSLMGDFSHSDSEPIWRQNGYQLRLDADSSDYLDLTGQISSTITNTNQLDMSFNISMDDTEFNPDGEALLLWGIEFTTPSILLSRYAINDWTLVVRDSDGTILVSRVKTGVPTSTKLVELRSDGVYFDGVQGMNVPSTAVNMVANDQFFINSRRNFDYGNYTYYGFNIQGETFDFSESTGNTTAGSSGTVATINTSDSGGTEYIDEFVWEKKSFALVGNGSTQKIVFDDLSEIILISTPLVGGFTQSGEVYNLTEGLGTKIYSTTGLEATIQGFTIQDLNFGGWLKGNDTDGWNPYTI